MPEALFTFYANDAFAMPNAEENPIVVVIDTEDGEMKVQVPEEDLVAYALIDDEEEPLPRALFVKVAGSPDEFQVGTAAYAREGLFVQYFPINEVGISFAVGTDGGHLGILDIRDVGKALHVIYYFEIMPVVLSIEGNYLVVKTLQYSSSDPIGPWYAIG